MFTLRHGALVGGASAVSKCRWLVEQAYRCSLHVPTGTERPPIMPRKA